MATTPPATPLSTASSKIHPASVPPVTTDVNITHTNNTDEINSDSNSKLKKKIAKEPRQPKIILRRLPPVMNMGELLKLISPIPEISYSYFTGLVSIQLPY